MIVVGLGVVPRKISYPTAPVTAVHESVTAVLVIKLPDAGAVFVPHPGGGGGGGGLGSLFLLQEFIKKASSNRQMKPFLKLINSYCMVKLRYSAY